MPRKKHYHVFHRKDLDVAILFGHQPEQVAQADYNEVAEVKAADLEEVFALTNHCSETPWWRHPQVSPAHAQPAYRSTSVGDVVQQGRKLWMVAGEGFVQVTWTREGGSAPTAWWQKCSSLFKALS